MKNKRIYASPKFEALQFEFEDAIAGASVTNSYDTEYKNDVNMIGWDNNEEDAATSNESWF